MIAGPDRGYLEDQLRRAFGDLGSAEWAAETAVAWLDGVVIAGPDRGYLEDQLRRAFGDLGSAEWAAETAVAWLDSTDLYVLVPRPLDGEDALLIIPGSGVAFDAVPLAEPFDGVGAWCSDPLLATELVVLPEPWWGRLIGRLVRWWWSDRG